MLRRALILLFIAAGLAPAQVLPERWMEYRRSKVQPGVVSDPALWAECEGEAAERALYTGPIGPFRTTAWRLRDSTSALAWYYALRPANCTPVRDTLTVCTTPGTMLMAHQDYVLLFEGWRPLQRELEQLYPQLPKLRSGGGLPNLPGFLPEKQRVRNSERYILGVESLAEFEPRIPPTLIGFEDGAEAELARYHTGSGDFALTLIAYPTPQVARARLEAFEQQAGWVVRRSGTLVAVVPGGASPETVQPILDQVQWDANFTWNEPTKPPPPLDVAGMLLAIFELTGLLLLICIGGGFLFAVVWALQRRHDRLVKGTEATITILNLGD